MDSALTPREIQSRIRAGESPADVARAAGVPVEGIEGYAAPVLAEREHMAIVAQNAQCRRGNGTGLVQLGQVARIRLESQGIDADSVEWDAWREEDRVDRHWTVEASYRVGSSTRQAHFDFDPRGRFAVASDDDARWLLGEEPPRPRTPVRTRDPDTEPTVDLNDEMAIVRAVQVPDRIVGGGAALAEIYEAAENSGIEEEEDELEHTGLTKVDGVYELVPNPTSDMDVLYDMLSGFDEDSVHVYAGLNQPVAMDGPDEENEEPEDRAAEPRGADEEDSPTGRSERPRTSPQADKSAQPEPEQEEAPAPRPRSGRRPRKETQKEPRQEARKEPRPQSRKKQPRKEQNPQPAAEKAPEEQQAVPAIEQEPLPGEAVRPEPAAAPRKTTRKRKSRRASVPSWDEIMFGGPRSRPEDPEEPLR